MALSAIELSWGAGTNSYQFLKIGTIARSSGMGGAFVAVSDDEAALYYNPSGLAGIKRPAFIASYINYVIDLQSGFVGYLRPIDEKSTMGASLTYFSHGDFMETNQLGDTLGTFGASDLSFNLSYARAVSSQLNLGATGKVVYERIQDEFGYGLAVDLGGIYTLKDGKTKIGAVIQNLGPEIQAIGEDKGGLPTSFKLGISHVLKGSGILFSGEADFPLEDRVIFNVGAEANQVRPLVLRVGYSTLASDLKTGENDDWAGLGFGIGFLLEQFKFDYAYSSFASLGSIHRITLARSLE
jgi:hypothetical protein